MRTRLFRPGAIAAGKASQADDGLDPAREKIRFVRPLEVSEATAGLHEKAEGINKPIYRISWHKKPYRLLGYLPWPGTENRSGKFVKVSPESIKMPREALRRYQLATNGSRTGEVATFIETELRNSNIGVILAVRNTSHWQELYRWHGSWRELGLSRMDISNV